VGCNLAGSLGSDLRSKDQQVLRLGNPYRAQNAPLREKADYKQFRAAVYEQSDRFFCAITCDSRETVPLTLALFYLAGGNVEKCVTYGANFGRDADTIASMCGAIGGALQGVAAIKPEWIAKVNQYTSQNQEDLATRLVETALKKLGQERAAQAALEGILA